jgi:hypothetical protein
MNTITRMSPERREAWARLWAAVTLFIGIISLIGQAERSIAWALEQGQTALWGLARMLGFFTNLTNLLVAWTMAQLCRGRRLSPRWMTGVMLPIVLVAAVYHFMLSAIWKVTGWEWMFNRGLHYIVPALTVGYWSLFVTKSGFRWSDPLGWLLYPLLYCGVALLRGALTGWFPYPFLDAAKIGWVLALINAAALATLFGLLGLIIVAATKIRRA